jgi:hypothetical protein
LAEEPDWQRYLSAWIWHLHVFSLSTFFASNSLLLPGWGGYCEKINETDSLPRFPINSFCFMARTRMSSHLAIVCVISSLITITTSIWCFQSVKEQGILSMKHPGSTGEIDLLAQKKVNVVNQFSQQCARRTFWTILLVIEKIVASLRYWTPMFFDRTVYLTSMSLDCHFFWISKAHSGTEQSEVTNVRGQKPVDVTIIEESGWTVVIFSNAAREPKVSSAQSNHAWICLIEGT